MAIVRWHSGEGRPRLPAFLLPGELVWASIINGLEDRAATGKFRPVVLLEARGSQWRTMGLTTNPSYRDGSARVPIPNPRAVGLTRPGWLWGDRLAWTSGIDIGDHIGWVDEALAARVIALAHLQGSAGERLLDQARRRHPGSSGPGPVGQGGAR
jgi:hypothetical protein